MQSFSPARKVLKSVVFPAMASDIGASIALPTVFQMGNYHRRVQIISSVLFVIKMATMRGNAEKNKRAISCD
jgi:hypothetical protein